MVFISIAGNTDDVRTRALSRHSLDEYDIDAEKSPTRSTMSDVRLEMSLSRNLRFYQRKQRKNLQKEEDDIQWVRTFPAVVRCFNAKATGRFLGIRSPAPARVPGRVPLQS
ncbi:hypothetical protein IF1G_06439 [Cordyceps javanica]|uniref:Uncharacterized protein n=1 Tax=Cordyceps javanica TaxID=43265 RepID=A0A545V169_9HYPO|nr:hypothetical protein IF1G_06439 [Cordyceps javanica]